MREVIIYPGDDNYWVAECPSLLGCISQDKTKEDANANIKETIKGYIAAMEENDLVLSITMLTYFSEEHQYEIQSDS
jgi:predicted RNase H-like HicB family nuclease